MNFTDLEILSEKTIFVLSCIIWGSTGHGQRAMSDETYDVILKTLKGEFNFPVVKRLRTQHVAHV